MVKKKMLLLLACASFLGLTACSNSNGSSVKESSSETTSASDKENGNLSATVKESDEDNGKKVMTINVTGDIPVADSDGEIAGADQESDVSRKVVTFGNFYQDQAGEKLTPC